MADYMHDIDVAGPDSADCAAEFGRHGSTVATSMGQATPMESLRLWRGTTSAVASVGDGATHYATSSHSMGQMHPRESFQLFIPPLPHTPSSDSTPSLSPLFVTTPSLSPFTPSTPYTPQTPYHRQDAAPVSVVQSHFLSHGRGDQDSEEDGCESQNGETSGKRKRGKRDFSQGNAGAAIYHIVRPIDGYELAPMPRRSAMLGAGAFVHKLYNMCLDSAYQSLIAFSPDGKSFTAVECARFSEEVLPKHYKHSNFSSFVRQLNMYGFHKINKIVRGTKGKADSACWDYAHPLFQRGRIDWLQAIVRKKPGDDDDYIEAIYETSVAQDHAQSALAAVVRPRSESFRGRDGVAPGPERTDDMEADSDLHASAPADSDDSASEKRRSQERIDTLDRTCEMLQEQLHHQKECQEHLFELVSRLYEALQNAGAPVNIDLRTQMLLSNAGPGSPRSSAPSPVLQHLLASQQSLQVPQPGWRSPNRSPMSSRCGSRQSLISNDTVDGEETKFYLPTLGEMADQPSHLRGLGIYVNRTDGIEGIHSSVDSLTLPASHRQDSPELTHTL